LGSGTLTLSGVNTYTGGTTINAGTLQLGNANTSSGGALGTTTSASVTFGAGSTGKLQLNGNATTIIDLNTNATVGTPIIENGSSTAPAVLTVNTANTDTYAGLLQNGSSQTLGLTKSGSGTLILTGLTNSQTGITIINGGILRASDITTYAAGNQNITSSILGQAPTNGVAFSGNNATLQLRYNGQSDSTSQTLTLLSTKGGALLVNASAPNATIDVDRQGGSGTNKTIAFTSSTIASSSTLNVTGADGYSLSLGTLVVGTGGSAGNVTVNPTTANLTIGTATSSGITNNHTLVLDGTSSGNTITGAMANGGISSVLSVTKQNTSSWTLSGASSYTGATTVNAGSLFVNGSTAAGSAVTVNNSGTTLAGSGIINGSVNVAASGANLSPGASGVGSTAILRTGALTLSSGSNLNVDLNNTTAGTGYDQASVTGTVSINGSNVVVTVGASLSIGDKFFILLNDSNDAVTGTFAQGATVTSSSNGDIFSINYLDNGDSGSVGNDISLTVTAVPEPSTWVAGGLAFSALAFGQRRRFLRAISQR
jgi:autotransporter-associated beta strand protein